MDPAGAGRSTARKSKCGLLVVGRDLKKNKKNISVERLFSVGGRILSDCRKKHDAKSVSMFVL